MTTATLDYARLVSTCAFCGRQAKRYEACAAGWEPYFWSGDVEISQPVCPGCRGNILYNEEFCEYETASPLAMPVHAYTFTKPNGEADVFYYLRDPWQREIDYIACHRPGATVKRTLSLPLADAATREAPGVYFVVS